MFYTGMFVSVFGSVKASFDEHVRFSGKQLWNGDGNCGTAPDDCEKVQATSRRLSDLKDYFWFYPLLVLAVFFFGLMLLLVSKKWGKQGSNN